MFIIEPFYQNYWKIVNIGLGLTAGINQRLIDNYKWELNPNYELIKNKSKWELLWDDNIKHVIIWPEDLKLMEHRKKRLAEYMKKLKEFYGLIDAVQAKTVVYNQLKAIITSAKTATTTQGVDTALAQIDDKINSMLSDLGIQ